MTSPPAGLSALVSAERSRPLPSSFFSRRLAEDAAEISARFDAGSRDEARFLLNELASDCAGCHVRLPDAREHTISAGLVAKLASAPAQTRARLLVATRQFDAALASYEASFASRFSTTIDVAQPNFTMSTYEAAILVHSSPRHSKRLEHRSSYRPAIGSVGAASSSSSTSVTPFTVAFLTAPVSSDISPRHSPLVTKPTEPLMLARVIPTLPSSTT